MPKRPRRFLLSTDPAARVYLDLATGAEIVEPLPADPSMPRARKPAPEPIPPTSLTNAVADCLEALDLRFDRRGDDTLRVAFQGKLMNPEVQIEVIEDNRSIRFRVDLQVAVPPRREERLLQAVDALNRDYAVAQLLFNESRRSLEAYHPVFLADMTPTPAFVFEQLRVVMHNLDVLHHTLGHYLFGSSAPDHAVRLAQEFEEGLMMLWQPLPEES